MALVAVGGLGRRECAPYSDLDLVLLHDGRPGVDELGTRHLVPDLGRRLGLDHSVRTLDEALDARPRRREGRRSACSTRGTWPATRRWPPTCTPPRSTQWRRDAPSPDAGAAGAHLGPLGRRTASSPSCWRATSRRPRGGLRDVAILRGIGLAGVADATRPAVRGGAPRLLDVRDALHVVRGRRVDRLLAQERDGGRRAARLRRRRRAAAPDRRVDARTIAYAMRRRLAGGRPLASSGRCPAATAGPLGPRRGRAGRRGGARPRRGQPAPGPEPVAPRVAAAAARAELPIARRHPASGSRRSARRCRSRGRRPAATRCSRCSAAGPGTGAVWEACDRYGLVVGWLPEWARMRSLPQHNPVHLFTVDRHLVAGRGRGGPARPRGGPARPAGARALSCTTSARGCPATTASSARRSPPGSPAGSDCRRRTSPWSRRLVRLHLLLPDVATRRDLSDPVTIAAVAEAVGDASTLDLLHALARADAAATGPAAWSDWKGRLIAELVSHVDTGARHRRRRAAARTRRIGSRPDHCRPSLVGETGSRWPPPTGGACSPRSPAAWRCTGSTWSPRTRRRSTVRAQLRVAVQPRYGGEADGEALAADLRRAVWATLPVTERLRARALAAPPERARPPRIVWHRGGHRRGRSGAARGRLARAALPGRARPGRDRRRRTGGSDLHPRRRRGGRVLPGRAWSPEDRAEVEAAVLAATAPA